MNKMKKNNLLLLWMGQKNIINWFIVIYFFLIRVIRMELNNLEEI